MNFPRLIAPYARKILLMIASGVVKAVNNTGTTKMSTGSNPQRLQLAIMAGETSTDVPRWQEYGLETYPKSDMEALIGFIDGNRSNGNVICVQDKSSRPTDLAEGDVVLYDYNGVQIGARSGKIVMGNTTNGNELLQLFDDLLTELQKTVDLSGTASTGKLFKINPALATIQSKLATIKGSL